MTNSRKLTTISVSKENYLALKRLGSAGDSFNDVLTDVLKKIKSVANQRDSIYNCSRNQTAAHSG